MTRTATTIAPSQANTPNSNSPHLVHRLHCGRLKCIYEYVISKMALYNFNTTNYWRIFGPQTNFWHFYFYLLFQRTHTIKPNNNKNNFWQKLPDRKMYFPSNFVGGPLFGSAPIVGSAIAIITIFIIKSRDSVGRMSFKCF